MPRKSYQDENRELAYQVYYNCRPNLELTVRKLRQHPQGFPATRQTLAEWREKYAWNDRAARQSAEAQKVKDVQGSALESALLTLTKQQKKYEEWFEAQAATKIDAQVQHAYNNLVQLIVRIDKQLKEKPDLYLMTPIVMEAFVKHIKSTVKDQAVQDTMFNLVDRFMEEVKPADAF